MSVALHSTQYALFFALRYTLKEGAGFSLSLYTTFFSLAKQGKECKVLKGRDKQYTTLLLYCEEASVCVHFVYTLCSVKVA